LFINYFGINTMIFRIFKKIYLYFEIEKKKTQTLALGQAKRPSRGPPTPRHRGVSFPPPCRAGPTGGRPAFSRSPRAGASSSRSRGAGSRLERAPNRVLAAARPCPRLWPRPTVTPRRKPPPSSPLFPLLSPPPLLLHQ
jgi:hypothetical protein